MNEKSNRNSANQPGAVLPLRGSQRFYGLRHPARFGVIRVLFLMALVLMVSSSALAQGGNTSRSKAARRTPRVADAVIISGNQLTLRSGYEIVSRSGNTVVVAKKSGLRKKNIAGTTVTATCACVKWVTNKFVEGTGKCTSTVDNSGSLRCNGTVGAACQDTCKWVNGKATSRGTTGIQ